MIIFPAARRKCAYFFSYIVILCIPNLVLPADVALIPMKDLRVMRLSWNKKKFVPPTPEIYFSKNGSPNVPRPLTLQEQSNGAMLMERSDMCTEYQFIIKGQRKLPGG